MTTHLTALQTAAAFVAADEAWSAEVARALPGVFNARYQPTSKGEEGTKLRELYEVRQAAYRAWYATR